MALAQERFSTDVGDDELDPPRSSRPGRARRAPEKEGHLARMVRELRDLEDDIVAKLTAAERQLSQLESRQVHQNAGYTSQAEFEERMLASTPVLRAMREAIPPAPATRAKLRVARREPADPRARQTRALTSIARTIDRLRGIDDAIHRCATDARAKLCAIEGMRIFEECGYSSFEEFLERAVGPSPVLASAVALVASEPIPEQVQGELDAQHAESNLHATSPEESGANDPDGDSGGFPPALFPESEGLFGRSSDTFAVAPAPSDGTHEIASAPAAPETTAKTSISPAHSPARVAAPTRKRFGGLVVTLVLCVAGVVAGAAAGVWSELATADLRANQPDASAVATASPQEPQDPSAKAAPAPSAQAALKPAPHVGP